MTTEKKGLLMAVTIGALAFGSAGSAGAQQQFITIGTGGVTGVYYPAGGSICRLVNRNRSEHGMRCSVESTGGSIENLRLIRNGELDFGVAQSDWQYHAYHGSDVFESDGPNEDLRAVFSLHPEPFTVVARADADITDFEDLQGKRVNVGNPGSGQRATMEVLMDAMGWSMSDFRATSEQQSSEQAQGLCDNNYDAFVFTVGHPSGSIEEAATTCDVRLVNVDNEAVQQLVDENPYYRMATIPGGTYRGNDEDVTTFGVGATVVSSADVSEEAAYQVTRAVFENFEDFTSLHPAFQALDKQEMAQDGLSAPLHEGAKRYFEEAGLLE